MRERAHSGELTESLRKESEALAAERVALSESQTSFRFVERLLFECFARFRRETRNEQIERPAEHEADPEKNGDHFRRAAAGAGTCARR